MRLPVLARIIGKLGVEIYNDKVLTAADALFSQAFKWNLKYHRINFFEKLVLASIYYVLTK